MPSLGSPRLVELQPAQNRSELDTFGSAASRIEAREDHGVNQRSSGVLTQTDRRFPDLFKFDKASIACGNYRTHCARAQPAPNRLGGRC